MKWPFLLVILGNAVTSILHAQSPPSPEATLLRSLIAKVENLEKEASTQRTQAILPNGTVVAFDLPEGCPAGWSIFRPATGRMIVGAGGFYERGMEQDASGQSLTQRQYRAHGGEEAHTLTIDEMPRHDHALQTNILNDLFRQNNQYPGISVIGRDASRNDPKLGAIKYTEVSGLGKPHNSMPPFLALSVCRKD